ncbi:MAG: hypothetical protein ACAH59_13965 [Pseudobdellovibrionaceae bacterium]
MTRLRQALFSMLLLLSLSLKAELIPDFIIEDLSHEILEADTISLTQEQRVFLVSELVKMKPVDSIRLKAFLQMNLPSFASAHLRADLLQEAAVTGRAQMVTIRPVQIDENKAHALADIPTYAKNRIGPGTFQQMSQDRMKVFVVGGDNTQLPHYISQITKTGRYKYLEIPSLYKAWGITKYLLPRQPGVTVPIMIWVVPPAMRYVRHYTTLFQTLNCFDCEAALDPQAAHRYELMARANVQKVLSERAIDYVAFGYEKAWLKEIETNSNLEILDRKEFSKLELGASIKVYQLKDKITKKSFTLSLFSSDQTVWGELAALHLKAFLNPNLKGVLFLGSAGSLNEKINPYDVSVPQKFLRPGLKVHIENFLDPANLDPKSTVHRPAHHGNTFSPIEQNRKYLVSVINKDIQTIDVEQSLVAEEIQRYNTINNTKILFGAVNVITDKPYSSLTGDTSDHDLDRLDLEKKQRARETSVAIALNSILKVESKQTAIRCGRLY